MRRRLRIRSVLALLCAFFCVAWTAPAQTPDPRVGEARAAFGAGRFDAGLELLKQVLEAQPEHPQATHLMGLSLIHI